MDRRKRLHFERGRADGFCEKDLGAYTLTQYPRRIVMFRVRMAQRRH